MQVMQKVVRRRSLGGGNRGRVFCLLSWTVLSGSLLNVAQAADLAEQVRQAAREKKTEFVVPAGEHLLPKGLLLDGVANFTLRGEPGAVLKLPAVAYAVSGAVATPAGTTSIRSARTQNLRPGMELWIEADGDLDNFTKQPKPYFLAIVAAATTERVDVTAPLAHDVPAGTMIRDANAPNLIEMRNSSQITIEGLTLDGGRTADDPAIRGHAQLCGVFATGRYSYEEGPSGTSPNRLTIRDCTIRNCFGRGVAFYAVVRSTVERTTIEDCADEAIDLDHFCEHCRVTECRVARCKIGMEMNDASRCFVVGNTFDRCETGLSLWRWCKQPGLNEENEIAKNRFTHCRGNGMQIGTGTARNRIVDNEIEETGRNGISLSGDRQIVYGNKISGYKLKEIAVNEGTHQLTP